MAEPLKSFITAVDRAIGCSADEPQLLQDVTHAMQTLVARDDWLPVEFTVPHQDFYQQFLLHCDPERRFSIVSFVWGPGQQTPIHDHTVWGVIGMLRGSEIAQSYRVDPTGMLAHGQAQRLQPGDVAAVSPRIGDIHRVSNAYADRVSISIHAYGTDIGQRCRHVFDPQTGARRDFISGYANVSTDQA